MKNNGTVDFAVPYRNRTVLVLLLLENLSSLPFAIPGVPCKETPTLHPPRGFLRSLHPLLPNRGLGLSTKQKTWSQTGDMLNLRLGVTRTPGTPSRATVLGYSERTLGHGSLPPIKPGDPCQRLLSLFHASWNPEGRRVASSQAR